MSRAGSWLIAVAAAALLLSPRYSASSQSLGELGRREAERRKKLEQEGVCGKVIEGEDPARIAPNGNLSTWAPASDRRAASARASPALRQPAPKQAGAFRTALQKLDRQIRELEARIALLGRRAQSERWAPPPVGRVSRSGVRAGAEERIRHEIEDLEIRLRSLKAERLETYDAARKAGYLPGEIDGKGINP